MRTETPETYADLSDTDLDALARVLGEARAEALETPTTTVADSGPGGDNVPSTQKQVAWAQTGAGAGTFMGVGVAGFDPTASSSRTKRATKLRHTPLKATTAYRTHPATRQSGQRHRCCPDH